MDHERDTTNETDAGQDRTPEQSAKERDVVFDDWAMI